MHTKVQEGHNEKETTRGASLRELRLFFEKEDSSKGYAGLRRITDEDGNAVWTILKRKEVVAELKKRASERREEEQRRDDLFSTLARTQSEAIVAASNEVATLRAELKAALEKAATEVKMRGEAEVSAARCPLASARTCTSEASLCL